MEAKKLKKDIISLTILAIVCLWFYFIFIPEQIPLSSAASGNITFTSRTFPYILAVFIFIMAGIGLIQSIFKFLAYRKDIAKEEVKEKAIDKGELLQKIIPYFIYIIIFAYGVMFKKFGFIFATLIIIPIMLIALKCKDWKIYLYVYAFAIVLYLVFKLVLRVPLP